MSVMWQIEHFVSICNTVHNARIVDNLGNFILNYHLHVCDLVHLYIWCNLYIKMIHKSVGILLKNQCDWIEYTEVITNI